LAGLASADVLQIEALLRPWIQANRGGEITPQVARLAAGTTGERRLAMARFLAEAGQWNIVQQLTGPQATLPVSASNAGANALYATALSHIRGPRAALDRLDQVLILDSNNVDALRGRAQARLRLGDFGGAEDDAQKLVAVNRNNPAGWLFLASVQTSAGNGEAARRTLWDAFHQVRGERTIYEELSRIVTKTEGEQAGKRLAEEYSDQRREELTRSLA
jgi:predicted Zn-dependent protease